ncbi:Phosphomannomutase/phosphoglucomutase [compost metagenome]
MINQDILFGGEISGHTFFKDKFYGFDDGIYAGLRMLEILDNESIKLSAIVDTLNKYHSTPIIKVPVDDSLKYNVVEQVKEYCINKGYNTVTIDGARAEFSDAFAIVRMSNTTPNLTLRFEAETEEMLNKIKTEFVDKVDQIIQSM